MNLLLILLLFLIVGWFTAHVKRWRQTSMIVGILAFLLGGLLIAGMQSVLNDLHNRNRSSVKALFEEIKTNNTPFLRMAYNDVKQEQTNVEFRADTVLDIIRRAQAKKAAAETSNMRELKHETKN